MNLISSVLYSSTLKELIENLSTLLTEEFKCDRWDLVRFYPEHTKFKLIHSSLKEATVNLRKDKFKLSETAINDLLSNNTIRFKKLVFSSHLSAYERTLSTYHKWQLIFPVKNLAQQIIGILFLFYPSGKNNNSYIDALDEYKDNLGTTIEHCFITSDYKKKIERYIINAKYREFYNDIVKMYETTLHPNEYFIKVASDINLFLGTPLMAFRKWEKRTARLVIEEIFAPKDSNLKKGKYYNLNETISSVSLKKDKILYKRLSPQSVKYKDETDLFEESLNTFILIPIFAKNEAIGDILFAQKEKYFSKNEIELFKEVSHHLKSVFVNYHFYDLLNERLTQLNLILKVSQELSSRLETDRLIPEVLGYLVEYFHYDNCAVLLKTPDNNYLSIHTAIGYEPQIINNVKLRIGEEGITGFAAAAGETIIVEDVSKDPRYIQGVAEAKWEVAVPLKISAEVIGVLDVESKSDRRIDYAELSVLEILAAHIASAIANSKSYQKELKRATQLSTLHKIARKTATSEALNSMVNETLNLLVSNFKFYSICFWMFNKDTQKLDLYMHIGENLSVSYREHALEEGLIGYAAKYKTTIFENNVKQNPYYFQSDPKVESEICVPIIIDNEIFGVLDSESTSAYAFDNQDLESLETIAGHLAVSIKKLLLIEELHQQAITDPLTNLTNRRHFNQVMQKEINRAIRTQRPVSLIIADLDHFKSINDIYGHLIGDQVLIKASRILSSNSRTMDIVARIGGDEFAIILPEADLRQAHDVAERFRNLLSSSFIEPVGFITASFGVSSFSSLIHSADEFITQADNAMYQAKKLGRNKVFKW